MEVKKSLFEVMNKEKDLHFIYVEVLSFFFFFFLSYPRLRLSVLEDNE